jgi:hypothetical protein
MRYPRYATLLVLFSLFSSCLFSQGLNTTASKDDWEEINFEFNSPILTDGYPSLLRLAELLQQNPGYKIKLEGHADVIGSNSYNQRLGERRAQAVREFLIKYGANANQITVQSFGETQPKIPDRSKEARFMNRRVFMTVTDEQGRVVSAGGISEALKAMKELMAAQQKCCEEILRRLDKLNDLDKIAGLLNKMAGENDTLRKELADLRKAHDALDQYVKGVPKPLTSAETAQIVDTRTSEQIERARMPRFSIINANVGSTDSGDLTFSGRGRLFMPFKEQFAVQLQGEYMYFRDRQEGQFDIGLVNRFASRAQAGLFASFKHVNFSGESPGRSVFTDRPPTQFEPGQIQGNGLLGQASLTLDYIFSRGRFGVFGSKGFLNDDVLNRIAISRNVFTEYYLRTVDQAGISLLIGLFGSSYLEGNAGYMKSRANADRLGGTARLVFPFSDRFAFTLEGGMNETLISRDNTGRVVAGLQFGNFMRPKDYLEGYNGVQHAVPADVPRVRYEVLTRTARTGNDAPVANAGPDQIGIAAGTVNLDGSASSDPDGDPITYQWSQVSGPSVSISGMNTARASFTAVEGQSYGFRLVVRDDQGQQGVDTVTVTTTTTEPVQIARFQAVPDRIRTGEQSTLDWQVLNATTVTITTIGDVQLNGQRAVSPTQTTQYRLTARNARGQEATAVATVTVEELPRAQFLSCTVSPGNIISGESATLSWATANADEVSISPGIGRVDAAGSTVVTPTQNTTYTLTATNARGPVNCSVTVQVTAGTAPRVVAFAASPMTITAGQAATLTWNVENADSVEITNLGNVGLQGSSQVTPNTTTTYTLTARNRFGTTPQTVTITVNPGPTSPPPTITACVASPSTSAAPGNPVRISWTTTNALTISSSPPIAGITLSGPVTVNPTATTAYAITVGGVNNQTATCTVNVVVTSTPEPPEVIIEGGELLRTTSRDVNVTAVAKDPSGGALTYFWEPLGTGAAVLIQGQATARIQIAGAFGDYPFRVTVRNAAGQTASANVTVRFVSSTFP